MADLFVPLYEVGYHPMDGRRPLANLPLANLPSRPFGDLFVRHFQ